VSPLRKRTIKQQMMETLAYRTAQPISLNGAHDMTICACSITGGTVTCIDLVDCYNIHITQCELLNSERSAINLNGCANILIDNCCVVNVSSGIHSLNSSNIQVRNNKMRQLGPKGVLVSFENTGPYAEYASSYTMNNRFE
jgi:parallel beta helix pectate lyase-like protein